MAVEEEEHEASARLVVLEASILGDWETSPWGFRGRRDGGSECARKVSRSSEAGGGVGEWAGCQRWEVEIAFDKKIGARTAGALEWCGGATGRYG